MSLPVKLGVSLPVELGGDSGNEEGHPPSCTPDHLHPPGDRQTDGQVIDR